jgi:predicted ATP-dependent endonuclease of OLD family
MSFTKFTVKNFKCFREDQSFVFAVPDPEKEGSGITYIVGANNSGKTTLIEALSIKADHKIKSSERIAGAEPEFNLFDGETVKRNCKLIRPESCTIAESPRLADNERFEIISSRRHWTSGAGNTYRDVGHSFHSAYEFQNRQNTVDVASALKTIEKDTTKYTEFIALVQRVIPEFTQFAVVYEDYEYIEYISGLGIRHKTELLGDGVITTIRILLQLYVAQNNPIIIDEPELSLHPAAQKKLLAVMAEYAKTRQIIISTHSPYFISWSHLKNGAVVNRIVKHEDKQSTIYTVADFSKYDALISAANWQQPFLMDEVAKEIFFTEDRLLFLEGQEDVGLLRKEESLSGTNIFGYGVRGKDNFKFAMSLAQDLGFKKAACIINAGESENAISGDLTTAFPNYKIIQWNKSDIRDKASKPSTEKEGYFDSDGVKKPLGQLDDFEAKLSEVADYLKA